VPSIVAALEARELSSMKAERVNAGCRLSGPQSPSEMGERAKFVQWVQDALLCAKVIAYAQGMALIRAGSERYGWQIPLSEMARIWKGGCIIRARLLDPIMRAFQTEPTLGNLLLAPALSEIVVERQAALRQVVALSAGAGIPVPALGASLSYFDAYRAAELPQNLTQAQRDAFGAHRYQRKDEQDGPFVHTDWLAG
jgi:6-phosphogluconate dehydrogenase